jgi:thioredoxin-related protein
MTPFRLLSPVYAFSLAAVLVFGQTATVVASESKQKEMGSDIHWRGFDDGLREAAKGNKYLFVDIYTDWCTYCKKMDRTTYREKQVVQKLGKDFISVKFNAESEQAVTWNGNRLTHAALAEKWGVEGFPTLLFLNSKGEIIGNFAAFAEADLMLKLLGYISSGSREKGLTFDEYLKKGET